MHRPWLSLAFSAGVFTLLALCSYFFPKEGIILTGNVKLKFPSLGVLFSKPEKKTDIKEILQAATKAEQSDAAGPADTSFIVEGSPERPSEEFPEPSSRPLITNIQYRSPGALKKFFEALEQVKNGSRQLIHIMHYGDSQIEGDRMTDFIRLRLQSEFGGEGPGLISILPVTSSVINRISTSKTWDRYTVFTAKDKRILHNNFGVLGAVERFSVPKRIYDTSAVLSASISITTTKNGGNSAMNYKKLKLFFGGAKKRTWCEFYDGPALMAADSLEAWGNFRVKEYNVGNGVFTHTFKFRGKDSPDFYGLSLEGESGVLVDNIALRGSSGTFFHQINPLQLKQFYEYLNVKLIILQFGGNALPAIQNATMAVNYAGYLRSQISIIKRAAPDASILFIGPADMNIRSGTGYETYPYLEIMRDEIKKAVLEAGCAFYDIYDSMGGRNSMQSWVEEKLAATDYIHFSPQGARKIAALFYAELMKEYKKYLDTRN
jgi:lysophospholipase L1-like esterase